MGATSAMRFSDLVVWQKLMNLFWPSTESRTTFQKARSSGSLPTCDGRQFRSPRTLQRAFAGADLGTNRFLNITEALLEETRYYLIPVQDLRYAETSALCVDIDEVARLLHRVRLPNPLEALKILSCLLTSLSVG
jgi:hypothetical protein